LHLDVSFSDYKDFADWLGCYHYKIPSERKVSQNLGMALSTYYNGNLTPAWHRYNDCEHFTPLIQEEIIQWILDSDLSRIPAYSLSIHVPENINSIA
jgi:hypothetical protein